MKEEKKLGYMSYPLGGNYVTIADKENIQCLILITLIGVEYDIAKDEVRYAFKTESGKYLYRKFGDFYTLNNQDNAELKWKEHCLASREKQIKKETEK